MYFDSIGSLIAMDGHGAFVWAAYFITLLVVATIFVAPRRRQKKFLNQLAGELKRSQGGPSNSAKEEG